MNVSWLIPKVRKWPWQQWYNYDRIIASVWIRCLQLIPFLQELNIQSKVNKWDDGTDIAVFLRYWNRDALRTAVSLKKKGVKIVLDTPVNYFSTQRHPQFDELVLRQFAEFTKISDCIFCASSYIAGFGKRLGYNTICLEDSINFEHFPYRKHKESTGPLKLIWAGISVKAGALNLLRDVIAEKGWKLIVISDKRPDLSFPYQFVPWKYSSFPREIVKGDVAVFPRQVDNEYDRGHSFFKIGAFLAQHVPVVCSPVPSYYKVITDNNGYFAEELQPQDWSNAIEYIAYNTDINFFENPISKFSTQKISLKYKAIFGSLIN